MNHKTVVKIICILLLVAIQACNTLIPSTGVTPTPVATSTASPTETLPAPTTVQEATKTSTEAVPTSEPTATQTAILTPTNWITPTFASLSMIDPDMGWGLAEHEIVQTTDGGVHWANLSPEGGFGQDVALDGFFLDASTAWVAATVFSNNPQGVLYRTADGGATWQPAQVPFLSAGGLFFLDSQNGWNLDASDCGAGSCGGVLYQTTDGGQTWAEVSAIDANSGESGGLPLSGTKNGISFRDPAYGWVGGTQPQDGYVWLYATGDGGRTWQHQDLALPAGFENSITTVDPPRFFNDQEGLLPVGLFLDTLNRVFYLTQDGGASWTASTPVENSGVYDCVSMQDCWVWDGARLDVTMDGGQTWTTLSPNVDLSQSIMQVDFVDPTTGWVIAMTAEGQVQLYKTTDGGTTWTPLIR